MVISVNDFQINFKAKSDIFTKALSLQYTFSPVVGYLISVSICCEKANVEYRLKGLWTRNQLLRKGNERDFNRSVTSVEGKSMRVLRTSVSHMIDEPRD